MNRTWARGPPTCQSGRLFILHLPGTCTARPLDSSESASMLALPPTAYVFVTSSPLLPFSPSNHRMAGPGPQTHLPPAELSFPGSVHFLLPALFNLDIFFPRLRIASTSSRSNPDRAQALRNGLDVCYTSRLSPIPTLSTVIPRPILTTVPTMPKRDVGVQTRIHL